MANGRFGGGNGSHATPYLVEDGKDLDAVRFNIHEQYRQTKNINLKNHGNWVPIPEFDGGYDGKGYTIDGMQLTGQGYSDMGLFAALEYGGYIQNVHLKSISVDITMPGIHTFGGIVGNNRAGTIFKCSVEGTALFTSVFHGITYVGGLVGKQSGGSIEDCLADLSIQYQEDWSSIVCCGGAIGLLNGGTVSRCLSQASTRIRVGGHMNPMLLIGSFIGQYIGGGDNHRSTSSTYLKSCFGLSTFWIGGGSGYNDLIGDHSGGLIEDCFDLVDRRVG